MDIVLVGHGPSILSRLGERIDEMTVVRCKRPIPDGCRFEHFGHRCDYLVVRPSIAVARPAVRWVFPDRGVPEYALYWATHSEKPKYSHGLAAAFLAVLHLNPRVLYVIGYDRLLGRFETSKCFDRQPDAWKATAMCHDWPAEAAALQGLGVPIIELTEAA